jgi:hypothetical protein
MSSDVFKTAHSASDAAATLRAMKVQLSGDRREDGSQVGVPDVQYGAQPLGQVVHFQPPNNGPAVLCGTLPDSLARWPLGHVRVFAVSPLINCPGCRQAAGLPTTTERVD